MKNSSGVLLGKQTYKPIPIGGLGYVTGYCIASDGSIEYCRTDVGGSYRRKAGESNWTQTIDSRFMVIPSPSTGASGGPGVFEIAIAPSNAQVAYQAFRARMLRTTNGGDLWVDDHLSDGTNGLYMNANGGNVRLREHKLTVDPINPDIVYFGSQRDGLWRRFNGVWGKISSIPVSPEASDGDKSIIIAVDPSSSNIGSGATLRKSVVYVTVNGSGLYKST